MGPTLHPVLPKLKGNWVGNFEKRGQVVGRPASEFDNVAKDLDTDGTVDQINAIPDVWARPLLFQIALTDRSLPMHEMIRGEWRGLLAMLALQKTRRLVELTKVEVVLPDSSAATGPDAGFLDVAASLLPEETLASNLSWRRLTVLRYGAFPIGMLSPTTLVCTSTDCYGRIDDKVDWFDGRRLTDPLPFLPSWEKAELCRWLIRLGGYMAVHPATARTVLTQEIMRLLDEYINEIGVTVPLIRIEPPGQHANFFDPLLTPGEGAGIDDAEASDVRIAALGGKRPGKKLLLICPRLADDWEMKPQQVRVWSSISLLAARSVSPSEPRTQIGGQTLGDRVEWRLETDLFTDQLSVVQGSRLFPGTLAGAGASSLEYNGSTVSPIMPLHAEILDFLPASEIAARLRFLEGPNQTIEVQFRLPLGTAGGPPRDFWLSRVYQSGEVRRFGGVPVLEVWPNFRFVREVPAQAGERPRNESRWKSYFTYYSGGGVSTFHATPYGGSAAAESESDPDKRRTVTRTEEFPEAIVCRETHDGDELGLLLLPAPDAIHNQSRTVTIGVDFGTTSTNLFLSEGTGKPEYLTFPANRFLSVTNSGQDRGRMRAEFLPGAEENTRHLLSLFHLLRRDLNRQTVKPLLEGHVYYVETVEAVGQMLERRELMADLKWGNAEQRKSAGAFLEQLCLQAMAEAACRGAGGVKWRFSYPTAFAREDLENFVRIWNSIALSCRARTGIELTESPAKETESVAAANYFATYEVPIEKGAVGVDIGGGTADIAVWQGNNEIKFHTSIRLAGRDLFINPLRHHLDVLETFDLKAPLLEGLRASASNEVEFAAKLDALLIRDQAARIMRNLPSLCVEPRVARFLETVNEGICGLFYYIGMLLRVLHAEMRYAGRLPNVFVGGHGSQILHWCSSGSYLSGTLFDERLRRMISLGSGIPETSEERTTVFISKEPKAEVAYGLALEGSDVKLRREVPPHRLIAGESLILAGQGNNGKPSDWNAELTEEHIANSARVQDLAQFRGFLVALTGKEPSASLMTTLRDEVNQALANYHVQFQSLNGERDERAKRLRLEPVFTLALKHYLVHKAQGKVESQLNATVGAAAR